MNIYFKCEYHSHLYNKRESEQNDNMKGPMHKQYIFDNVGVDVPKLCIKIFTFRGTTVTIYCD